MIPLVITSDEYCIKTSSVFAGKGYPVGGRKRNGACSIGICSACESAVDVHTNRSYDMCFAQVKEDVSLLPDAAGLFALHLLTTQSAVNVIKVIMGS